MCGLANRSCGFCTTLNSVCGSKSSQPQAPRSRICFCASGRVETKDSRGAEACVKPPVRLFDTDIIPQIISLLGGEGGDPVLNITLSTVSKVGFIKTVNIFPADSFLRIDDSESSDGLMILYLIRPPPNANAKHDFTITAVVNYTDDDVIIKDALHLVINTSQMFPTLPPVRPVFVVDGTRKGALVFDLLSVLGSVDGLRLTLDTVISKRPFKLEGYLVVCEYDIHLKDFASSGHIGTKVTTYIKNFGQIILDLRVAVIANRFHQVVKETDDFSMKVANFANLVEDFDVSLFSTGIASNFFQLSRTLDYVHLTQMPDYETASQRKFDFDLTIKPRDSVFNPQVTRARARAHDTALSTTISTVIEVRDMDDTPPKAKHNAYRFALHQGAYEGTILGFVEFTDPDTSLDQLVYTIVDYGDSYKHLFRQIDPVTQALILNQKLPQAYSDTIMKFNVTASDGLSTSDPVIVFVHIHKFVLEIETVANPHIQRVNLNEEGTVSQVVTSLALVNYTGYSLQVPSDYFIVDKKTGEIKTIRRIDREMLLENPLTVSVTAYPEDESCIFEVVGNASIFIMDINDNKPKFVPPNGYNITILEHTGVNTSIIMVSAEDADNGTNAELRFSLLGPDSSLFAINSMTGLITVRDSVGLDREKGSIRDVTVIVTDGKYRESTQLTVTLVDINDNNPVFSNSLYRLTVWENGNPEMDLETLTATDLDAGDNGDIRFHLFKGGLGYFTLNSSTAVLSTMRSLDREQTDSFNLTVLAFDKGSPPRSASATVSITVLDLNDVTPHFESTDYFQTLEEGTDCNKNPIFSLTAQDDDVGANSEIIYSIGSGPLAINSNTGQIFCPAGLDYEKLKGFTSVVTAKDKGQPALNSTTRVHLTLKDVNDNSPTFLGVPYHFSVYKEHSFVGAVYAEDRDSGANGNVTYSILSKTPAGKGLLRVSKYGLVTLTNSSVDLSSDTYQFQVVATDQGEPSMQGVADLNVSILPAEIETLFTQSEFTFTMVENVNYSLVSIGQLTSLVQSVTFYLEAVFPRNTPEFRLDNTSGHVFCDQTVDREEVDSVDMDTVLTFSLYVKGQTSEGFTSYAAVRITILDMNDNSPSLLQKAETYAVRLPEGNYTETIVRNISAIDPDFGRNGTVVFSANDSSAPFKINPVNGSITVSGVLDREAVSEYILIITISDSAPVPRNTSLTWSAVLTDINDNPPEFDTTYPVVFSVAENSLVSDLVGSLKATDRDLPLNGQISYSVVNPDSCPCDVLGATGQLKIKPNQSLDYDDESTREYTCVIRAENIQTDVALFSDVNITIQLTDVNDNAPVFLDTTLNVTVSRSVEADYVIVNNLTATDADSGQNKNLIYALASSGTPNSDSFRVDPLSGAVTVSSLRDVPVEKLTLNITVTDTGDPPLADFMLMHVFITDNNTSPQFMKLTYNFSIMENINPSDAGQLLTVSAVDFEDGKITQQCDCNYSIVSDKPGSGIEFDEYFQVDSESGKITLKKTIDRELTGNELIGHVVVVDKGQPPKSSSAQLNVTVLDDNDNGPQFSSEMSFLITVNESTCKVGDVFYTLRAFDRDLPPNDQFQFSIKPSVLTGSNYVDIKKQSGELYLKSDLCSEETSFQFNVMVTEVENKKLTDIDRDDEVTVAVIVRLRNQNNSPMFTKTTYYADLPFSSDKGTTLSVPDFSATDADGNTLIFGLLHGNSRDLFQINNQTGVLTLQYSVDNTIPSPLNLIITVTDQGDIKPQFAATGTTTVVVTIRDPTVQTCLSSSEASELQSRAEQFTLYRALFIVLVILLVIAILVSVIFIYKWYIQKVETEEGGSYEGDTRAIHPMFQPVALEDSSGNRGNVRLGDSSGLPPKPPRRQGRPVETGESADSGLDSAGYLAPSVSAEHPSDQNISWPQDNPTPHNFPRRPPPHMYLALIPSATEEGILGTQGRQSDMYLHPTSEAAELHPSASEVDDYLHPIREPWDFQPAGQSGESGPYHHPTTARQEPPHDYDYSPLRPGPTPRDSPDLWETESYLHPIAGPSYYNLPPPSPHSSHVIMPSPRLRRDPEIYESGMSRSLGQNVREPDFSDHIPVRDSATARSSGLTSYHS